MLAFFVYVYDFFFGGGGVGIRIFVFCASEPLLPALGFRTSKYEVLGVTFQVVGCLAEPD